MHALRYRVMHHEEELRERRKYGNEIPWQCSWRSLGGSESSALHSPYGVSLIGKIPAPIKIKLALPPPFQETPTPTPKRRNFMGMGFPAERTKKCQAPIRLAQPFPVPELRAEISLRAKGTLISEPRFSPPATCDFSHARKGKRSFQRKTLDKGDFPFSRGKKKPFAGGRKSGLTKSCAFGPQGLWTPRFF